MPHAWNDKVRIHYEVEGSGPLKSRYRLIMVDARGHGASDKPHNQSGIVALMSLDPRKVHR